MKVLKFGGTSVGSAERFLSVAQIVLNEKPKVVVLSAMSGITDSLIRFNEFHKKGMMPRCNHLIAQLKNKHKQVIFQAICKENVRQKALSIIEIVFNSIEKTLNEEYSDRNSYAVVAKGELLSTLTFKLILEDKNIKASLVPALDFMKTDINGEPDYFYIKQKLNGLIQEEDDGSILITQGFICRDYRGEVFNLQRGGSDYTASIIGSVIGASEVQIWTDIDGFHNNDPRFVEDTKPLRHLSFEEAAELAYFGAKILHPTSIIPCKKQNIPVWLKNSLNPTDQGTIITRNAEKKEIKAVAAKDGITVIKINSGRMFLAYGFLKKVFEVFEKYKTPIDVITTSEVAVSVTIDNNAFIDCITDELRALGAVEAEVEQCIVCVVGDLVAEKKGVVRRILEALSEIPIRMISYGGSRQNVTVVFDGKYKLQALNSLNSQLFNVKNESYVS